MIVLATTQELTSIPAALMAVQEPVQLHARERSDVEHLRNSIRSLCVLAHHNGMPPERLVVDLNQALSMLTEEMIAPASREDVRKRVVAPCHSIVLRCR